MEGFRGQISRDYPPVHGELEIRHPHGENLPFPTELMPHRRITYPFSKGEFVRSSFWTGRANGVAQARDGKLQLSAPQPLPSELMEALRQHKKEILAELCNPEVMRRAALFREHLNKLGPVLFYVLPGAKIQDRHCQTCGAKAPTGRFEVRCRTCKTAARRSSLGSLLKSTIDYFPLTETPNALAISGAVKLRPSPSLC